MSEKRNAFYYREHYYLLPPGYSSVEELKNSIASLSTRIRLQALTENNRIRSNLDKGICIAPYFYSEYGYAEEDIVIEDLSDIYPVQVELLSQREYNDRIRSVILDYCPGCQRYKPLSTRVQSLNGHFREISLDSVCFFRQNSKPAPRVFRRNLFGLGGLWMHFDPCGRNAEDVVNLIKSVTYMKYDAAKKDKDPRRMAVSFKPDFYMQILTDTLESYIENALHFTEFRLQFDQQPPITKDAFEKQINEAGRDLMRKNCKRYGVSLAKLCFDPSFEEKVIRSLEPLMDHFFAVYLLNEPGELYLLLLDECQFLKELHFRAPLLEAAEAKIAVYNQYEEKRYRISFNMEKHNPA